MYQQLYDRTIGKLMQTDSTFVDYDRNHVFFDILRFSSDNISREEKQDMYYQFNCYQRILDNSRSGKPKLAAYWINHLSGLSVSYTSDTSQHGINCIHHPALAYHHYVEKDYANALNSIEDSFRSIDALFNAGFQEAVFMKIEQKLNEFRIHYSAGRKEDALLVSEKLLCYLVSGEKDADFQIAAETAARDHDEVIGLFNYCFDSMFFKIYRSKDPTSFQDEFMERIIAGIRKKTSAAFEFLQQPLEAFHAIVSGDGKTFADLAAANDLLDDRLPAMMRYAFLLSKIRIFRESQIDMESFSPAFLSCNKNKLKLPDAFVDVFIKAMQREKTETY